MRPRTRRNRRGLAIAAIAVAFAATVPGFGFRRAAPAGAAVTASHSANEMSRPDRRRPASVPQTKTVKAPVKKRRKATSTAAGLHLGKRDYAEFALLALAPFVVMGMFLFGSGYRRVRGGALGPVSRAAAPAEARVPASGAGTRALRVPEVAALFWVVKALSTAMGESTSDYLVHAMPPVAAVLLGFAGFAIAMSVQFSQAPLCRVGVLARDRDGRRVRHDGRRCSPCRFRRPVRRVRSLVRRGPRLRVRLLAPE